MDKKRLLLLHQLAKFKNILLPHYRIHTDRQGEIGFDSHHR